MPVPLGVIMELKELAQKCIENIAWCNKNSMKPLLALAVPAGRNPSRKFRKPFGASGPAGQIIQWGIPSGKDTCLFDTVDLLAYLVAMGAIATELDAQQIIQARPATWPDNHVDQPFCECSCCMGFVQKPQAA